MNSIDEIYNQALELLSKGHSQEEVLVKFAEYRSELTPLLEISALFLTIPKNVVPTPLMQRKYAAAKVKTFWLSWAHLPKLAGVTMSLMLLVSSVAVMGYETIKSSPGQTLFAVKKSAEKLQLILALSQNGKASVQIQIAQKRLNEAQEIFGNPNSNPEQKTAALNELADQTSSAVAQVNAVSKNNPASEQNHPLLSSLGSIAKDQQNLLLEIKPDSQVNISANTAIHTLTEKISEIKQSVAVADSEQTLAKLKADPNAVTALGDISKVSKDQITVNDSVFILIPQTIIKNSEGKTLSRKDLSEKSKVNVVALKNQNSLVAQQIVVISIDTQPEVKDASTSTASISSLKKVTGQNQDTSSSTTSSSAPDEDTAVGSVIFEAP